MSYTDEQMNGIRQAGLDLAPQKEIRMLKNSKQLAYKLEKKELFINKKREREPVVIKEVLLIAFCLMNDQKKRMKVKKKKKK